MLAVALSAIALPVQPVSAQDAQPCEPRRDLPTADDPPADRTTFLLTTTRAELGPVITELELRLTRFGPSDGAVGVYIDSFDLSAVAGEHYVEVDDWVRWEDGEVGEKTFAIEIIDHDPSEPERVFGVAMNGVDPPSLGGAEFEYDDQIDLYIPGACPAVEPPPETTTAPETTVAPATTVPLATELPETGERTGTWAASAALLVLVGGALIGMTRRRAR
jgi:LPXTG-motif cell wall-anchored protein